MRPIELDLAARTRRWPALLALLAGAAMTADALFAWGTLQDEAERLQRRRDGAAPVVAAPKEPVNEQTRRELDTARRILQELSLPWEALFGAIEGSLDKDTALLAIEPDAGKRVLRIGGEARHYPAILGLMRRLEGSGVIANVHLVSHQIREETPERPYQFMLAATWRVAP